MSGLVGWGSFINVERRQSSEVRDEWVQDPGEAFCASFFFKLPGLYNRPLCSPRELRVACCLMLRNLTGLNLT